MRPQLLPFPAAPIGAPAPEIGDIACIASDVDEDGRSIDPLHAALPPGRRLVLGVTAAFVTGIAVTFVAGAAFGALLGVVVSLAWWTATGQPRRLGSCVYVGTAGITQILVDGSTRVTTTVLYRDAPRVTTARSRAFLGDLRPTTTEAVSLWRRDGRLAMCLTARYDFAPTSHAIAIRAVLAALT